MKIISIADGYNQKSLSKFDCGNILLNLFLTKYALENDNSDVGKTYLLMDGKKVAGYVTICTSQIEFQEMPQDYCRKYPRYPVPSVRIARLAVDISYQKRGLGKKLLSFAFSKILYLSTIVAIKVIVVDAKEESKTFYERFGFKLLKSDQNTYFMTIDSLKKVASN